MIKPLLSLWPDAGHAGEPMDLSAEVWHACDPGRAALATGPLTFRPPGSLDRPGTLDQAWKSWLKDTFTLCLLPVLLGARDHAAQGRVHELRELDSELGRQLDAPTSERLSTAGRTLLGEMRSLRALSWPHKFSAWLEAGACRAHFPIVFAGRCASFHLPPRTVLLGYAMCEWRAAFPNSTEQGIETALEATEATLIVAHPFCPAFPKAGEAAA